jgi:transposase
MNVIIRFIQRVIFSIHQRAIMDLFDLPNRAAIRAVYRQGEDAVVALAESLNERIRMLEKRMLALEDKLAKDSHNSHKPPTSDRYKEDTSSPRSTSIRRSSGKKSGAQLGHAGTALKQVEKADKVIELHTQGSCDCGRDVTKGKLIGIEKRQVFDIPEIRPQVTEYRADIKQCSCGTAHTAAFPQGVNAPAQYGSNAKATATYFMNYQLIPYERTAEIFNDVFHLPLCEGTLYSAIATAYQSLEGTAAYIARKVQEADVAHFDESGLYVIGKRYWLHTAGTQRFTIYNWHPNRGQEAMDAIGILPDFTGTAVHDDYASYMGYDNCQHALCNAHHIRDLTFLFEQHQQQWAGKMLDLLTEIKDAVAHSSAAGHASFRQRTIAQYTTRYMDIVAAGKRTNPLQMKDDPSRRGKTAQSKSRNLLERLSKYRDNVLAFMHDFAVPFDNNLAERDIRMLKVQQKISGCFRSTKGADAFCRIRSFISTVKKQGRNIIQSVKDIFDNTEPSANLLAMGS